MKFSIFKQKRVFGGLLCGLCAVFIAGCGTTAATTTDTTTTANAGATATVCAQQRSQTGGASNGTIQSISGDTLTLTTRQGNTVNVSYSSSTAITQQQLVSASALREGNHVTVGVQQNSDSTYTATRITLSNGATGVNGGGFGGGQGRRANSGCFAARGNGTRGGNAAGGQGGSAGGATGTNSRAISGTVGQVSNNVLTVTDTTGNDYSINLTPNTQIVQTSKVNGSILQKGQTIIVAGKKSSGTVTAQSIAITLPGTLGQSAATPTK